MQTAKIFSLGASATVASGVLQLQGGVPLDTTLRSVTDQAGTVSPLQLSTTQINFGAFAGAATGDIVWKANATLTEYTGWHQSDGEYRFITKNASPIFFNISWGVNFSAGFSSSGRSTIDANGNWTIGGSFANAARLHVRGDGTNPIVRFENGAASSFIRITEGTGNGVRLDWTNGSYFESASTTNWYAATAMTHYLTWQSGYAYTMFPVNTVTATTGVNGVVNYQGQMTAAAGSANFNLTSFNYTINNSGAQSGTATGIFLNATETALNGMAHNLMDLQKNGVSQFKASRDGVFTVTQEVSSPLFRCVTPSNGFYLQTVGFLTGTTTGVMRLSDNADTSFNRLQFGGTTNAFPAIKRNGAGIDFRLADDSGYCNVNAAEYGASVGFFAPDSTELRGTYLRARGTTFLGFANSTAGILIDSSSGTPDASAILQLNSTTKGFLPPRLTGAQADTLAAASPAEGLLIYVKDTTATFTAIGWWGFNGTSWVQL